LHSRGLKSFTDSENSQFIVLSETDKKKGHLIAALVNKGCALADQVCSQQEKGSTFDPQSSQVSVDADIGEFVKSCTCLLVQKFQPAPEIFDVCACPMDALYFDLYYKRDA